LQINEPITEEEIKALFSNSSYDKRLVVPKARSRPGSPVASRGKSVFEDRTNLAAQVSSFHI
jgi:hypothetical protein